MMTPNDIISAARSACDVPFRHQGRDPAIGLDCIGLIAHIARIFGLPHQDRLDYGRTPGNGELEAALDRQPCLERISSLEPACVVLFRISRSPQHVGIYTGESMVHAWSDAGKVCEHPLDDRWRSRIVRMYRFKEPS